MRRYLLLSASMGSGHLDVAGELRRRLTERGDDARVVDILAVMPFGLGAALRSGYSAMLRRTPWLYDAIYRSFFIPRRGVELRADPLVAAATPAVRSLIERAEPDVVVSVFHLCAQIAGGLRARGELTAHSTVVVTDFVAHRLWLHPGNDAILCVHPEVAADAAAYTGVPAVAPGPVVPPAFMAAAAPDDEVRARVRRQLQLPPDDPVVLMSAGAWGSGRVEEAVGAVLRRRSLLRRPVVVLCGRNEQLRAAVQSRYGDRVRALGWRDDVADLMRACDVLVENAAGQTAMQAFAVGLPVVTHAPIPGHGRDGARRMHSLGVSYYARSADELTAVLYDLARRDSAARARLVAAGRALFTADPATMLAAEPVRRVLQHSAGRPPDR